MGGLNTLKRTAKAAAADLLRFNTQGGTKNALLNPKRYDEYSRQVYMGVPPPGPDLGRVVLTVLFGARRLTFTGEKMRKTRRQ